MKSAIFAGALAALAVGAALANEPTSTTASGGVTFKSLDANGDGRISQTEAQANPDLSAGFSTAVSDPNKGMTQAEFDAWNSGHQQGQTPPSQ
jgi:hypothetical protein